MVRRVLRTRARACGTYRALHPRGGRAGMAWRWASASITSGMAWVKTGGAIEACSVWVLFSRLCRFIFASALIFLRMTRCTRIVPLLPACPARTIPYGAYTCLPGSVALPPTRAVVPSLLPSTPLYMPHLRCVWVRASTAITCACHRTDRSACRFVHFALPFLWLFSCRNR